MHLGEVALQLLLNQPEAQEAPDCLRRIDETAPLLLAARRFDVVEETLRALKDLLLLEAYLPTEVAQLTRGCLDGFASEERIGLVLDAAVGGEAPPSAPLVGLFRAGGEAAVEAALARLASAPDEQIRSRLVELIVAAEPDVFKAAVARVRSEGGEGLRLLFLVFRHPKAAGGVEFAATFAGNKDPGVRLEAFRVLFEADPRAGQHDRYVQRALSDRDPRIVELGVEQALKEPEVTAVRLLSRFVEETLRESDPARTRRAASALAELDSAAGREALARLLRARRMQLRPSQVRLSQALGAALARNPDPETAKAIREFRRSPAGWMSWLLGPQTEAA